MVERKVDLPTRRIRRDRRKCSRTRRASSSLFQTPAVEVLRFFRTLPKASSSKTPLWIARGPNGLFATTRREQGNGVTDSSRLRVLHALLPFAPSLGGMPTMPNRPTPGSWISARRG